MLTTLSTPPIVTRKWLAESKKTVNSASERPAAYDSAAKQENQAPADPADRRAKAWPVGPTGLEGDHSQAGSLCYWNVSHRLQFIVAHRRGLLSWRVGEAFYRGVSARLSTRRVG